MTAARLLVMGVSGSGKTTVGRLLATRLTWRYVDADDLQPEANVRKMAQGVALNDEDRVPWLDAVAEVLMGHQVVIACSALRRIYRDRLRAASPDLQLLFLRGERDLLAQRLANRQHAYMPPSLLGSQLDTLEPPTDDEHAWVADIHHSPERIVADFLNARRV